MLLSSPCDVWSQDPQQVISNRHQAALVELALADAEDPGAEVDIDQGEVEGFADAQPGAIQQEQDRPIGVGVDTTTRMVIGRNRIEQAPQFLVRVDVGHEYFPWL